ncbi:MAG: hypothetical protein M2R46_02204 [Verrucomicrobia subdivision 3 bacterium]|nr:hypothetical protein [Limisphaerales bacterium]
MVVGEGGGGGGDAFEVGVAASVSLFRGGVIAARSEGCCGIIRAEKSVATVTAIAAAAALISNRDVRDFDGDNALVSAVVVVEVSLVDLMTLSFSGTVVNACRSKRVVNEAMASVTLFWRSGVRRFSSARFTRFWALSSLD